MKLAIALTAWATVLLSVPSPGAGADRDAADRQTRQESDELRADIRQRRLKKIRDMEEAARNQKPAQGSDKSTSGSKPGG